MNLKEARALVDSREKLDPNYAKAVEMCIEDDKTETEDKAKDSIDAEVDVKVEVKPKRKVK